MGVNNSPDVFHEKINDLFQEFKFIHAYIDNILILSKGDWNENF